MNSPHHRPLRLGTRGSPLALAQAGWIARQLRERCGQPSVVVTVATPGDESTAPIERLGTTGVFTTTLRAALLRGAVDFVVHSGKDLPTAPVPGLQVAAFPAREDPRDALIWPGGTSLDALPPGARIGTGSPRRAALLCATGRQLQIVPMRGNVDTRLRKLADGEVDALVLAMAGLSRLGLLDAVATPLDPLLLMPAPAQGVLAVECRTDDPVTAVQLRTLDHAPTRAAAITERELPGHARRRLRRTGRRADRAGRGGRSRTGGAPVRTYRRPGRLLGDPGAGDRCGRRRRRARPPAGSPAAWARRRRAARPHVARGHRAAVTVALIFVLDSRTNCRAWCVGATR